MMPKDSFGNKDNTKTGPPINGRSQEGQRNSLPVLCFTNRVPDCLKALPLIGIRCFGSMPMSTQTILWFHPKMLRMAQPLLARGMGRSSKDPYPSGLKSPSNQI